MGPKQTVADLLEIKNKFGFSGVPVTDTGKLGGRLLGLVTLRDIDFFSSDDMNRLVSNVCLEIKI